MSTSRPAPAAFLEAYEAAARAGADAVVSVHISGDMSSTIGGAELAAAESPVPVTVVDSRAMGMAMGYAVLAGAIEASAADPAIRCLLLTGEGEVFCAGNDIGEFQNRAPEDPNAPPPSKRFYYGLANYEKPIVAAVPGLAIGIVQALDDQARKYRAEGFPALAAEAQDTHDALRRVLIPNSPHNA